MRKYFKRTPVYVVEDHDEVSIFERRSRVRYAADDAAYCCAHCVARCRDVSGAARVLNDTCIRTRYCKSVLKINLCNDKLHKIKIKD